MPRLACVNIPNFPLQILLARHPAWKNEAVAVLSLDSPNGHVLSINTAAEKRGVRRGMRYATALTLEPRLQADVVPESVQLSHRDRIVSALRRFAPEIEICDFDLGTLWLEADGLFPLFASYSAWMDGILESLRERGFEGRIAVGFSRIGSYLVAGSSKDATLLQEPLEERRIASGARVELLPLPPKVRQRLFDLGLYTVHDFLQLPGNQVARRLGNEAAKVYRFASGDLELPFQGVEEEQEFSYAKNLSAAVTGVEEVMTHLQGLLEQLVVEVTEAQLSVLRLRISLYFEDGSHAQEEIAPATATTRLALLDRLIRLRLGGLSFTSRIEGVSLECDTVEPSVYQGNLFGGEKRRHDWEKAAKAFTLIQAEFGNQSISVAQTRRAYLPEEQYAWIDIISRSKPLPRRPHSQAQASGGKPVVVRRLLSSPMVVREKPQGEHRGGPFFYTGGWWDKCYDRSYHYIDDDRGTPLWLYYDESLECWLLQGAIQ